MKSDSTTLVLATLLALTSPAWAEDAGANGACTVKKEDVKTWIKTIDGKEYQVRPATPAYDGDTGLFHLSSAYTLPKGGFSFSLYRDNLDRGSESQKKKRRCPEAPPQVSWRELRWREISRRG